MKINEIASYILNHKEAIAMRLHSYANALTGQDLGFHLDMLGESYTNGQFINIGISDRNKEANKMMELLIDGEEDVLSMLFALTVHESEHVNSSDFRRFETFIDDTDEMFEAQNLSGGQQIAKFLANAIEDGRIERRAKERNPGVARLLNLLNAVYFGSSYELMNDPVNDLLNAILLKSKIGACSKAFAEGAHPDAIEAYKKIESLIVRGVKTDSALRCMDSCKEIRNELMGFFKKHIQENQKMPNSPTQQGKTEKTPSQDNVSASGEHSKNKGSHQNNDANQQDKQNDNNQKNSAQKNKGGEIQSESLEDLIEKVNSGKKESAEQMKETAEAVKSEMADISKEEKRKNNFNLSDSEMRSIGSTIYLNAGYKDGVLSAEAQKIANTLRREVLALLRKRGGSHTNLTSGNIDVSKLVDYVGLKETKIFQETLKKNKKRVVCYLLIDASGSMSHPISEKTKMEAALETAAIIEYAFHGAITLKIAAYNYENHGQLRLIKQFEDKESQRVVHTTIEPFGRNCDGDAVMIAAKELQKRNEENKVIISISDGLPSVGSRNYNPIAHLENAVKMCKEYNVRAMSIGIEGSEQGANVLSKIYGKNFIQGSSTSAVKIIAKILKEMIR